jgi:hypothetical protein
MLRAGVVAVLAVGSLLSVPVAPAMADDPGVQITSLPTATLGPGQRVDMKFRVTNKNLPVGQQTSDSFNITVTMPFAELTCQGQCNLTESIDRGQSKDYTATLIAGTLGTNQTKSGNVQIDAKSGGDHGNANRQITVRGPEQAPMVKEVNGKVTDSATGAGLRDVLVGIQDSQNHTYLATTNRDGRFSFVSSATKPIVPGEILITAQKDDYKVNPKRLNANAGQTVTTTLAMTSTKPPEPTATAEVTESALPSEEPSDTALATDGESLNAAAADSNDSGGGLSWVLIVMGGLLVAIGVGAIVLLLVRRKEDDGDEDGDFTTRPRGPVPTPASRGMYRPAPDPTRAASRVGAGAGPTLVARPPMADAPTMMHQPAPDPYADPYGASPRGAQAPVPPPAPTPYGAAAPGWANASQPTTAQPPYGSPGGYGSPSAPGETYGTPAGGYGTPAGGYGGPAGGYSGPAPFSPPGAPEGGYGSPAAPGRGYGNPAARPADEGYGGRDYSAPTNPGYGGGRDFPAPASQEYGASGSGYSGGYAESGGRYDADPEYGRSAHPYESGRYQPPAGGGYQPPADPGGGYDDSPGSGGYDQAGYGQADGGYDRAEGGYDRGGYGQSDGGYDDRSGYDRVPEQRSGHESPGYDPGRYRDEAGGAHSRHAAGQPPTRAERRSLDWLDD